MRYTDHGGIVGQDRVTDGVQSGSIGQLCPVVVSDKLADRSGLALTQQREDLERHSNGTPTTHLV